MFFDEPFNSSLSFGLPDYSYATTSPIVPTSSSSSWGGVGDFLSGALQSSLSLGNGYLSRRLDIDLANRLSGFQPNGTLQGGQITAAVSAPPGYVNLGGLLPIALIGMVAFLLLKD